jgi:hypothetical protein
MNLRSRFTSSDVKEWSASVVLVAVVVVYAVSPGGRGVSDKFFDRRRRLSRC